jgi:hypothetical protein
MGHLSSRCDVTAGQECEALIAISGKRATDNVVKRSGCTVEVLAAQFLTHVLQTELILAVMIEETLT